MLLASIDASGVNPARASVFSSKENKDSKTAAVQSANSINDVIVLANGRPSIFGLLVNRITLASRLRPSNILNTNVWVRAWLDTSAAQTSARA